jgi:hypothetical protein
MVNKTYNKKSIRESVESPAKDGVGNDDKLSFVQRKDT